MLTYLFKASRKMKRLVINPIYNPIAKIMLYLNGATFQKGLKVAGILKIDITRRGKLKIGTNLQINSGANFNVIGRQQKTTFWVEGELIIGDNVGMSATAIICNHQIIIGNNVTIGGNTVIYDTDFHNLDPIIRKDKSIDKQTAIKLPVLIEDNVFIGAHTTILKGVTIGKNSIIGACSVVTKNIPSNEIWAGNPAKSIKMIKC
ncbi:MAG: transferase [Flavobacteriales bacterium 32-34-25]|nr:MAG: transferase [Flavobacteriales bacterium 32-34-25]